ncbi:hypothetical protein Tco_1192988 [Tanacetum coccineum]
MAQLSSQSKDKGSGVGAIQRIAWVRYDESDSCRTLGDYPDKPRGYRNTIRASKGNKQWGIPLIPGDTIRLVQNGCSFHGLRSEDPNQHLKDFLKLVDSLDLDGENRERTRLRTINQSAGGKLRDLNPEESWEILEDLTLYDNKSWNDPRDFAKPVKAIPLPQDVPSTSDRCLIELENQVQRFMEAHLAPTQPTQVNKITTPCKICSGPHDTQCCMENPKQAFVEYASSRTDEARGKWYTFKPEQNNLGDTYNPSWRSHPNIRWRQPKNSQNNLSNLPNRFQPNGSIPNRPFNNRPQNFNKQSNIEGLVSEFMASQDAILSKFEADFKQQQSEMTNKIDTVLKAITDRIASTLPSDTVKNPKLGTRPVSSAHSYPTMDPQCSTQIHGLINTITINPTRPNESQVNGPEVNLEEDNSGDTSSNLHLQPNLFASIATEQVRKLNSMLESLGLVPQSSNMKFICSKEDDGRIKGMHVFDGNFTYVIDFMIVEEISSILDPRFIRGIDEVSYKMPHKIEQYDSLSDLEKEHTKSVYLMSEEDKRRGVEYLMSKILGFYKECLELGPEYLTGVDD